MKKIFQLSLSIAFLTIVTSSQAQRVTLDYYFNHEVHKDKDGSLKRYHYLWDETANSGFLIWGDIFKNNGAVLDTLAEAPTLKNLSSSCIYIIVDPDSKKENPHPNYINGEDAGQIMQWVKNGGVLVMMANDSANVDLVHFNILAAKFGMHFNNDLQNHVIDDQHFSDGEPVIADHETLKSVSKVFLKDVCSISHQSKKFKAVLKSKNGTDIAVAGHFGKGYVLAIGDPWFYNEYMNGRLPKGYENVKAAIAITNWLLKQSRKNHCY